MSSLLKLAHSLDARAHTPAFWAAVDAQLTHYAAPPPYTEHFSECAAASNDTLPLVVSTLLAAGLPHVTSIGVITANRRERKQFETCVSKAIPRHRLAVVSGSGIIRGFYGDLVLVSKRALSDQLVAQVIEPLLRISSTRVITVD